METKDPFSHAHSHLKGLLFMIIQASPCVTIL